MINCLRPSNRSSKLTLPLGPSNSYFFSTAIHGIRRRSAASASRERVKAFSFASIFCHAACHSVGDTIGGVFIAMSVFDCLLSLSLPLAISFLLFVKPAETTHSGGTRAEGFPNRDAALPCADEDCFILDGPNLCKVGRSRKQIVRRELHVPCHNTIVGFVPVSSSAKAHSRAAGVFRGVERLSRSVT